MSAALMTSANETLSTPNSRKRRAAHSTILCRFFCACSCDERPIIVVPFRTRSRFVTVCRRRRLKKPPPFKQSGLAKIDYIHYLFFWKPQACPFDEGTHHDHDPPTQSHAPSLAPFLQPFPVRTRPA